MFCLKCGEAITDGSKICPICGAIFEENDSEQAVVYASQKNIDAVPAETGKQKKKIPIILISVVSIAVCIAATFLIIFQIGKTSLKNDLVRNWYAIDGSIIKVLDISNDTIEYRLETGYSWLNTTLGTYDWKVTSSNTIKIKRFNDIYETFTVEINDQKTILTITPAITSTDPIEVWYNIDD